jgi:hypothetical protein
LVEINILFRRAGDALLMSGTQNYYRIFDILLGRQQFIIKRDLGEELGAPKDNHRRPVGRKHFRHIAGLKFPIFRANQMSHADMGG